ncbi:MAG: VCBS repeat-containing protein [Pararhodobacter sp.]|nr:VCBS repeat-containing protein [Pararhodobacter sp.]
MVTSITFHRGVTGFDLTSPPPLALPDTVLVGSLVWSVGLNDDGLPDPDQMRMLQNLDSSFYRTWAGQGSWVWPQVLESLPGAVEFGPLLLSRLRIDESVAGRPDVVVTRVFSDDFGNIPSEDQHFYSVDQVYDRQTVERFGQLSENFSVSAGTLDPRMQVTEPTTPLIRVSSTSGAPPDWRPFGSWQEGSPFAGPVEISIHDGGVFRLGDGPARVGSGTGSFVIPADPNDPNAEDKTVRFWSEAPLELELGAGPAEVRLSYSPLTYGRTDRIIGFDGTDSLRFSHSFFDPEMDELIGWDILVGPQRPSVIPSGVIASDANDLVLSGSPDDMRSVSPSDVLFVERRVSHSLLHVGLDENPGADASVRLDGNPLWSHIVYNRAPNGAPIGVSRVDAPTADSHYNLYGFLADVVTPQANKAVTVWGSLGHINEPFVTRGQIVGFGERIITDDTTVIRMQGFDTTGFWLWQDSNLSLSRPEPGQFGPKTATLHQGTMHFWLPTSHAGAWRIETSAGTIFVDGLVLGGGPDDIPDDETGAEPTPDPGLWPTFDPPGRDDPETEAPPPQDAGPGLTVAHDPETGRTTIFSPENEIVIEETGERIVLTPGAPLVLNAPVDEPEPQPEPDRDPEPNPDPEPGPDPRPGPDQPSPFTLYAPTGIVFGAPIYAETPLGADWGLGQVEWERAVAVDITGDGQHEVVISTTPEGANERPEEASPLVVLGWRDGALVELSAELLPGPVGGSIVRNFILGDFNRDGTTDILVNSTGTEAFWPFPGERNVLLISDGEGRYGDATHLLPDYTDFSHGSVAADFTGNGHLDLYINNLGERDNITSYLLLADGEGGFGAPQHYSTLHGWPRGVSFDETFEWVTMSYHADGIDYGGNGINDIFLGYVTYFGPGHLAPDALGFAVAVNDGAGNFTLVYDDALAPDLPMNQIRNGTLLPEMTRVGDVTGNGLEDLIVLWVGPDLIHFQFLENRGADGFVDQSHRIGGQEGGARLDYATGTPDFFLTDFNADGHLDIVLSRWTSDFSAMQVHWFQNDGEGNFARIDPATYPGTIQSVFADVNGDGVPDMVYMVSGWDLPEHDPSGLNYAAVRLGRLVDGETVRVTGTVTDRLGNDITGASLVFTPQEGVPDSADADVMGRFALDLPVGATGHLGIERSHAMGDPAITATSALEVLRLAVGLPVSWGAAGPLDFIAADFNGDGQVNASDALDILRVAVGLPTEQAPRWIFIDASTDVSGIDRMNAQVTPGRSIETLTTDLPDMQFTGVLIGHLQEF